MTRPRLTSALRWSLAIAALAVVLAPALLLRPGVESPLAWVVVAGDSMEPTLSGGDVVVVRRRPAYRVGETVAYRVPRGEPGAGIVVIHRIVGGDGRAGYRLRGDNKHDVDPWSPRDADVVGGAVAHLPRVGLLVGFLRTPLGLALLAAAVTFTILLAGGEEERRRRPAPVPAARARRRRADDPAPPGRVAPVE